MTAPDANDEDTRRARAWVEHLRTGGSTPWLDFDGTPTGAAPRRVPGAAQLEVARRLNLAAPSSTAPPDDDHRALVDRILRVSVPGRGQLDLDLVGVPHAPFGPPPVDPVDIAPDELLRVAVGALAEGAVRLDPGEPRGGLVGWADRVAHGLRNRRPWHRGLRLAGDPLAAAGVRSALARRGHVTGRRSPVAVVLADDLGTMLADTWAHRLRRGKLAAWPGWLANAERNDALPPSLDLPAVLERKAAEVGPTHVHLVVGADPGPDIAGLLGLRGPLEVDRPQLSAEALEVLREVNAVLGVMVHPGRHRRILARVLLPRLGNGLGAGMDAGLGAGRGNRLGVPRAVPAAREDWVRRQAERLRAQIDGAGYPVHGDLDDLLPREGGDAPAPSDSGVLDAALQTLLKMKEGV